MREGRVVVIPFFKALQIDVLETFLWNPGEILELWWKPVSSGEIPVTNSGEIPANSGRACLKTGYPQKTTSPLGNKRETILCLACASLRLALSLACVRDFARPVFCLFRLLLANLWNKWTMREQTFARQLFCLTCVESWNSGSGTPGALNFRRAFWGWRTAVFRAKLLPVYGFDSIGILFWMGEILKYRIQATPKEIRPEGSQFASC